MVNKRTVANKTFRAIKSFRVSVDNRNVRLEKGLECEMINETMYEYCMKIDSGLEWWIGKDKLSTYFEEVGVEPEQP